MDVSSTLTPDVNVVNEYLSNKNTCRVRQRSGTIFGRLCIIAVIGCVVANSLFTFLLTEISRDNYPGGAGLSRFNDLYADRSKGATMKSKVVVRFAFINGNHFLVHVHIANLAAQSGASLFLHEHSYPYPTYLRLPTHTDWIYNKTENMTPSDLTSATHFTHLIVEDRTLFSTTEWLTADCIKAFAGVRFRRRGPVVGIQDGSEHRPDVGSGKYGNGDVTGRGLWKKLPLIEVMRKDKLCILERK